MLIGISENQLIDALKRMEPTAWSLYLANSPEQRGALFTVPGVDELRVIRFAQHVISCNIYGELSPAYIRLEFLRQLSPADDRPALGLAFDRAYCFYYRLCSGANSYITGLDPDLVERFPSWEIYAGDDSPLAPLNGKRYRKTDPVWNEIFPPVDFDDPASVYDSEGRDSELPEAAMARICNPVDFLRAMGLIPVTPHR